MSPIKPFIDYYTILQVDPRARHEIIVSAFRKLAMQYHPDFNQAEDATARMQEINAAYEILGSPRKRALYDSEYEVQVGFTKPPPKPDRRSSRKTEWTQVKSTFKQLLYQSDFKHTSPDWLEKYTTEFQAFHRKGYFHINIADFPYERYNYPDITVSNFRAFVETRFSGYDSPRSECGLIFMANRNNGQDEYYRFIISKDGYYSLHLHHQGQYHTLLNMRFSSHINRDGVNRLMVEMLMQHIKVGINGEILASTKDDRLPTGSVGILACARDKAVQVKFRDFRVYAI